MIPLSNFAHNALSGLGSGRRFGGNSDVDPVDDSEAKISSKSEKETISTSPAMTDSVASDKVEVDGQGVDSLFGGTESMSRRNGVAVLEEVGGDVDVDGDADGVNMEMDGDDDGDGMKGNDEEKSTTFLEFRPFDRRCLFLNRFLTAKSQRN